MIKITTGLLGIIFIFSITLAAAQTIATEEEFVVQGEPSSVKTTAAKNQTNTIIPSAVIISPTPKSHIYIGMSKYLLMKEAGRPSYTEKFRSFAARNKGIYNEVWTYTRPTGNITVYIKEGRVQKVEY